MVQIYCAEAVAITITGGYHWYCVICNILNTVPNHGTEDAFWGSNDFSSAVGGRVGRYVIQETEADGT